LDENPLNIKKENIIVKNIGQLCTLKGAVEKQGRRIDPGDLGLIKNAAMIITDGKVQWVGDTKKIPKNTKARTKSFKTIDAQGGVVLPGFVDSHTHLVFAGDRSGDFESRLQGKSYSQIAKEGGGILRTMQATRKASTKALFERAMTYLKIAASQGITTLEIKTGYGLDFKSEKKCLDVIAKLKKSTPQKIMATCLAAHAVPPEFKNSPDEYIQNISNVWLKKTKEQDRFCGRLC
jgi:imidazolonepropionase